MYIYNSQTVEIFFFQKKNKCRNMFFNRKPFVYVNTEQLHTVFRIYYVLVYI